MNTESMITISEKQLYADKLEEAAIRSGLKMHDIAKSSIIVRKNTN